MACFGAVSLSSGRFVRMLAPKFNSVSFELFLKRLLRHRSRARRMVVVLDNAPYHHAAALRPLLRKYHRVMELLFLPIYSPQLAPIERLWKLARHFVGNAQPVLPDLEELIAAVSECFDRWKRPNSALRRLCGII